MPIAEFVELRGLMRCLGSECVVHRLPADEQDIEARARSFGLWEKATLPEQFLHFEGVVCGLVDRARIEEVRASLPALTHRVL